MSRSRIGSGSFEDTCLRDFLQSPALANQFKPAILQCFGDIASAIGGHFETYLSVVAQVLHQAAGVKASKYTNFMIYNITSTSILTQRLKAQMVPMRCSTMLSRCVKVSWMPGVV